MSNPARLPSWRPGATRDAVEAFLESSDDLAPIDRVAMFDNDGTLWAERPRYAQEAFFGAALRDAVAIEPSLAARPEYAAILDADGPAMAALGLPAIALALADLFAGWEPHRFATAAANFVATAMHPTLGRPYARTIYQPMIELLEELSSRGFAIFVVTGGGTEFVRAVSNDLYAVPADRVVGTLIRYQTFERDGRLHLERTAQLDGPPNEGAAKVENIQRHLGRQPALAAGNTRGDKEMLDLAMSGVGPHLALLIDHDDGDREFAYRGEAVTVASAEDITDVADRSGWVTVSMCDDWSIVFPDDLRL